MDMWMVWEKQETYIYINSVGNTLGQGTFAKPGHISESYSSPDGHWLV